MHYQGIRSSQQEKAREMQIKRDTELGATKIGDRLCIDCQGKAVLDFAWRMSEMKSIYSTTNRVGMC